MTLARRWSLLDPFVTVMFTDRKIGILKKGEAVKATCSLVYAKNMRTDAPLDYVKVDCSVATNDKKHASDLLYDSSTATESAVIVSEGNYNACIQNPGDGNLSAFCEQTNSGAVELLTGVSACMSDREGTHLVVNANSMRDQWNEISANQTSSLDLASLTASGLDSTCIQLNACRYNFLLTSGNLNCVLGSRETSSSHEGDSTNFHSFDKQSFEQNLEAHNEAEGDVGMISTEEKNVSIESQVTDIAGTLVQGCPGEPSMLCSGCQIEDDDLLVSTIIKKKAFCLSSTRSSREKCCKSKALIKRKSQKGCCRLLPRSLSNGGKHFKHGKLCFMGVRTVLSWLIDASVISINDVVQYRNTKDDAVTKDGLVSRDGIICRCCSKVITISQFKVHAGFKLSRPCLNLFMESGEPFTLCLLRAWSAEYKARKREKQVGRIDDNDKNDDSCGLCADGGELICCDNCPSTFHQTCLGIKELPEGSWYCRNCTCQICGNLIMRRA
ncbi:Acyl-CoA N-acyltransferase with RING/FYVE/PHD-type zinc finger protein, putative isoform 1 [Quillaja saponaria]|uniref:Acyl-CoA N-acyltransferase with RING/FYVE/PHD-type zinc finger protein, putative isoform 1 n=1 Tax=Quillaja saponaria TaxID=32244 RepID=A0AAD7QHW9_QUISA|nr:Acyl-CoA N-acyltransferase with RING/FYVE/PHD-type zinc finger protein, putative isoform 1 [Quillaja saponaria]